MYVRVQVWACTHACDAHGVQKAIRSSAAGVTVIVSIQTLVQEMEHWSSAGAAGVLN